MKVLGHIVLGTATGFTIALLILISIDAWEKAHWYHPGLENESTFLRNYDVKPLILPFKDNSFNVSAEGRPSGGSGGRGSVTHSGGFEEYFAIRVDRKAALMLAANEDVTRHLVQDDARILYQTGTPDSGLHIVYTTTNAIGSIVIEPLEPAPIGGRPLPVGLEFIAFKMKIVEEWYPKGLPRNALAGMVRSR